MTQDADQTEDARHAAKMAKIKVARDKIMRELGCRA